MNEATSVTNAAKGRKMSTSTMVKVGLLATLSIVLMQIESTVPIFPGFLKLDVSDLPAVIGALALGPVAGVFIELIKNLLHFVIQTKTAGVGELANFFIGVSIVVPIGLMYQKRRNVKGYIAGALMGVALMVAVACVLNYYVLIPLYAKIFGASIDSFVSAGNALNSRVVDYRSFILLAIAPFNILKGLIVTFFGFVLYKLLGPVLRTITPQR